MIFFLNSQLSNHTLSSSDINFPNLNYTHMTNFILLLRFPKTTLYNFIPLDPHIKANMTAIYHMDIHEYQKFYISGPLASTTRISIIDI